jgi:hypothetical protein
MKQLTTEQKRLYIDLLQVARKNLSVAKLGSPAGLCYVIDTSVPSTPCSGPELMWARRYLCRWIDLQLRGKTWLETWLEAHYKHSYNQLDYLQRRLVIRNTRLAWLDWMIKELEEGR